MACSPLGCVTACVVYGRFDSIFDSNEKNDSQVPNNDSIWAYLSFLVCILQLSDKENL